MSERTLGDLIERVTKAQRNLGPRNPSRVLLAECLAVIRFLGTELVAARSPVTRTHREDDAPDRAPLDS
jgi:hypothetical protein